MYLKGSGFVGNFLSKDVLGSLYKFSHESWLFFPCDSAVLELIFSTYAYISAASGMVMIFAEEPLINESRVVPEVSIQFDELASL